MPEGLEIRANLSTIASSRNFLVERSAMDEFDRKAEALARHHDGVIRFKLTGPLPPHHFVSEQWAS